MQMDASRIDVWRVELSGYAGDLELLGPRERARAARLRIDDRRRQFIAAQTALRKLLARYLDELPAAIEFAYGTHGKPALSGTAGLGFNLTHSGDLALVAVGSDVHLGVDVEYEGRDRPFLRLAQRYFARPEHEWLASLGAGEQRAAFYRAWVLKEAYLKAVGTGLTFAPRRFTLDLETQPPELRSTELPGDGPARWQFADLEVAVGYAAAVCWSGDRRQVVVRGF